MIPALTPTQWAERPELRAELQAALALPCMQAAMATLKEGGLATMTIPKGFPVNMDPMLALSLTNAQKAGGLNFLKNLIGLPNLSTGMMDHLRALSDPAIETPQPTN